MTAVMQPYFFPYPAYFQLLAAADNFVFYDDVQFINQGYINRNQLRNGGFTIPLRAAPLETIISERLVDPKGFPVFTRKWRKGLQLAYGKEPFFEATMSLVDQVLDLPTDRIADLAERSVCLVMDYLGLGCKILKSSNLPYDRSLSGTERLLALLRHLQADRYVNSIGGRDLYREADFASQGITLRFLESKTQDLPSVGDGKYSILHLLFQYPPDECRDILLHQYQLSSATDHSA